jgi:sugar phosphate isomerase/epimerase
MNSHSDIRIGTMANKGAANPEYIRQLLPHGFESFQLFFWQTLGTVDLKKLAADTKAVLAGSGATVSSLGMFGNPLTHPATAADFRKCIDAAPLFGCDLVCGFAGRLTDQPVPASMKAFKKVFAPLAKRAADKGVRIAFENCDMGGDWERGDWNIAHSPAAWEMMFHEIPADNIGLEWEPCHQLVSLIDPLPQLKKWLPRIFHVHGKDATVDWSQLRESGLRGDKPYVWHRTPGFGDTNWTDVISILRMGGYKGSIDIEGWHDPVYKGDLEMTGQVHALNHLKRCRGGDFVPNPRL